MQPFSTNWHQLDAAAILKQLSSTASALTAAEAEQRLQVYGHNLLPEKKGRSAPAVFFRQFKDVMILILLIAAVVSGVVGDAKDATVILLIVLLNAIVGFIQEYRAENAMAALKKMAASCSNVLRDGKPQQIRAEHIVPGDIVLLQAGDRVPADLRLLEAHSLKIDEASLTGESQSVDKTTEALPEGAQVLAERVNMAYRATMVTHGRGSGVVVATGSQTEIGRIAELLQEANNTTPLQKRLADFGKKLSAVVLFICILLFIAGLFRGVPPLQMLLTAISLAVAAIPEALPAVITLALSFGAKRLVRQQALIRKLPAVETLGSVTFICTDKTGTLTQNRMTVQTTVLSLDQTQPTNIFSKEELFCFSRAANADVQEEAAQLRGDPTEVALFESACAQPLFNKEWLVQYPRVSELPFDSVRKRMTTVHQLTTNQYLVITKGAVESITAICSNPDAAVTKKANEMAAGGLRVIAYSYKFVDSLVADQKQNLERDQYLLGLAGLLDPPRAEARQAVVECKEAGIVPVMITGDHPLTATAIATQLGILAHEYDKVLTGQELEQLSATDFESIVTHTKVYARVSPEQKLRIVQALQKQGEFVAMTGDGVNDAPALKQADIGVAMGITGTDVSKEAASMILLDDNFSTIVKAVREGRRIYDNIRKFIRYIMTGNCGEIWAIVLAPLAGMPVPLLPIHILWINLVTDGLPALALAKESSEKNIMRRGPRPTSETVFSRGMAWQILWTGVLIGCLCIALQAWDESKNGGKGQSLVFTALCFCQLGVVLAVRSEQQSVFHHGFFTNRSLLLAVLATFILQLLVVYLPAGNRLFQTKPLTATELAACLLAALVVFAGIEAEKWGATKKV